MLCRHRWHWKLHGSSMIMSVCAHDCMTLCEIEFVQCQNTSLLPFATRKANKIEQKNTLLILAAIFLCRPGTQLLNLMIDESDDRYYLCFIGEGTTIFTAKCNNAYHITHYVHRLRHKQHLSQQLYSNNYCCSYFTDGSCTECTINTI